MNRTSSNTSPGAENDLVSVIIPNRNYVRWLPECIDSCLRQTWSNLEIIVVDDASTHDSRQVLAAYGDRIRLISLNDRHGPGYARNVGLAAARGGLIQFLDSDDYLAPDKIERQYRQMQADGSDMCISAWREILYTPVINLPMPRPALPPVSLLLAETIRDRGWFPVMACLFRKTLTDKVGAWNADLEWNEDREYRFRLLCLQPRISVLDECLFFYRRHTPDARAVRFDDEAGGVTQLRINRSYFELVSSALRN